MFVSWPIGCKCKCPNLTCVIVKSVIRVWGGGRNRVVSPSCKPPSREPVNLSRNFFSQNRGIYSPNIHWVARGTAIFFLVFMSEVNFFKNRGRKNGSENRCLYQKLISICSGLSAGVRVQTTTRTPLLVLYHDHFSSEKYFPHVITKFTNTIVLSIPCKLLPSCASVVRWWPEAFVSTGYSCDIPHPQRWKIFFGWEIVMVQMTQKNDSFYTKKWCFSTSRGTWRQTTVNIVNDSKFCPRFYSVNICSGLIHCLSHVWIVVFGY